MRELISIVLIAFIGWPSSAQESNYRLDSLRMIEIALYERIRPLQEQLDSLREEIRLAEIIIQQGEKEKIYKTGITLVIGSEIKLRNNPDPLEEVLIVIPPNSTVTVHDFAANYYKIKYKGVIGWVHEIFIPKTSELNKINENAFHSHQPYDANLRSTTSQTNSSRKTWVKGHYRTQNGKKVWVRGHYRKN